MNDLPQTGGVWQRDPKTGALSRAPAAPPPPKPVPASSALEKPAQNGATK